jgi:hypothetical protein
VLSKKAAGIVNRNGSNLPTVSSEVHPSAVRGRAYTSDDLVSAGREVQAAMAVLRGEYLPITAALDALGACANANAAAVDKWSKGKIDTDKVMPEAMKEKEMIPRAVERLFYRISKIH